MNGHHFDKFNGREVYDQVQWDDMIQQLIGRNIDTSAGRLDYNYTDLTVDFADSCNLNNNQTVFIIGFGALIVYLDENLTLEIVEKIAELKEELESETMRVVFKDSSFKDSVDKTNAIAILKQFGINEVVSV